MVTDQDFDELRGKLYASQIFLTYLAKVLADHRIPRSQLLEEIVRIFDGMEIMESTDKSFESGYMDTLDEFRVRILDINREEYLPSP